MRSNKEDKFVSVVVYLHNDEKFVELFIKKVSSMLSSSFLNYELICVDDGSSDNTIQKAKVKKKIVFPTKNKSKEQTNKDTKEEKKDAEGQKSQDNKQTENNTKSAPEKGEREINAMW